MSDRLKITGWFVCLTAAMAIGYVIGWMRNDLEHLRREHEQTTNWSARYAEEHGLILQGDTGNPTKRGPDTQPKDSW